MIEMAVTFLFKLLLILILSLIWVGRRMSLHLWFCFWSLSLSHVIESDMREWLVPGLWQWADFSKRESVILHCWFSANGRFLKMRESYFTLLILRKWEFRKEYVQTIKCLLHGRGVPQNSGKLLSVPWVNKDCGVLLRTAQEVTGSLILCNSWS